MPTYAPFERDDKEHGPDDAERKVWLSSSELARRSVFRVPEIADLMVENFNEIFRRYDSLLNFNSQMSERGARLILCWR